MIQLPNLPDRERPKTRSADERRVIEKARGSYWELRNIISDRELALKERSLSTTEANHLQDLLSQARRDLEDLKRNCLKAGVLDEIEKNPPPLRSVLPGGLLDSRRKERTMGTVDRVRVGLSSDYDTRRRPTFSDSSRGRASSESYRYATAREQILMKTRGGDLEYRRGAGLDAVEAANMFIERTKESDEPASLGDITEAVLNFSLTRGLEAGAMLLANLVHAGIRLVRIPRWGKNQSEDEDLIDRMDLAMGNDRLESPDIP